MNSLSKHQPWTDLAVFDDLSTGQAVETLLTNAGIQARAYDDRFFRRFLFLRPPRKTFRLQVHRDDIARAQAFLFTLPTDPFRQAIHCPECGSLRVSYPQMTRKFILPTVVLHASILLRLNDHQCYCEDCHSMWSLPETAPNPAPKVAKQPV